MAVEATMRALGFPAGDPLRVDEIMDGLAVAVPGLGVLMLAFGLDGWTSGLLNGRPPRVLAREAVVVDDDVLEVELLPGKEGERLVVRVAGLDGALRGRLLMHHLNRVVGALPPREPLKVRPDQLELMRRVLPPPPPDVALLGQLNRLFGVPIVIDAEASTL